MGDVSFEAITDEEPPGPADDSFETLPLEGDDEAPPAAAVYDAFEVDEKNPNPLKRDPGVLGVVGVGVLTPPEALPDAPPTADCRSISKGVVGVGGFVPTTFLLVSVCN